MNILKSYLKFMARYPIRAQIVQTGLLMGAGDIVAQTVVEKTKLSKLDTKRTLRFLIIGGFVTGPCITVWFSFLNRTFPEKKGVSKLKIGVQKMFLDQLIICPIMLCVFLTSLNFLKGRTWQENVENIKQDGPTILKANYAVWPAIQLINFTVVPYQVQVVFLQVCAIFWNTFISFVVNKEEK